MGSAAGLLESDPWQMPDKGFGQLLLMGGRQEVFPQWMCAYLCIWVLQVSGLGCLHRIEGQQSWARGHVQYDEEEKKGPLWAAGERSRQGERGGERRFSELVVLS